MNVTWDYTKLAAGYVKRPDYAPSAINDMLKALDNPYFICDVGAGDGHLTLELLKRDKNVVAVEPNDEMRANGLNRTATFENVKWEKGTGEETGQPNGIFGAVTFGSSFNVCDQMRALAEARRICKEGGGFACMWNHRDLNDPIQKKIEEIITKYIPHYDYGNRRQDQTDFLNASGLVKNVNFISGNVTHKQTIDECVEAWRSHGTLHRQCKDDEMFNNIISDIEVFLKGLEKTEIEIPYNTKIWTANFI